MSTKIKTKQKNLAGIKPLNQFGKHWSLYYAESSNPEYGMSLH